MADDNLQHVFVTELTEAESASASDYILLSQKDDSTYISKKLQYSRLCAAVIEDIDNKISSSVSAALGDLTLSVENNTAAISALSAGLGETTSAVIKIANCVQKNKSDISAISSEISSIQELTSLTITGQSGINVSRTANTYNWQIKHTNSVTKDDNLNLKKIKYDAQGHIIYATSATSSDIKNLGYFVTEAGTGLQRSDHTVSLKPASSGEIGGVKINGNNLQLLNTNILSAKDTTYSAGSGISILNTNAITLTPAKSDTIGGIKVGANLSVTNDGVLCAAYIGPATTTSAGIIQLGFVDDTAKKWYALTALNGKAYVHVPWTDTVISTQTGTITTKNKYDVISAISYSGGNLTGLSSSTALYDLIYDVSSYIQTGILSDCVRVGYGNLAYDNDTGTLELNGGDPSKHIANTDIPSIISGEVTTSAYSLDGEHEIVTEGLYLQLNKNTAETSSDNIYIDIKDLSNVYSAQAGGGLSCTANNQFYILSTETWQFTLDDGSTTVKTVALI